MISAIVYFLCGLTSLACAVLLFRSYRSSRSQLAFWTAIAFVFFTINNVFVMADFIVFPTANLYWMRIVPLLLGAVTMIFGLVKESVE